MKKCFKCGKSLDVGARVDFKAECPHCMAYIHCCKNCRLHDPFAHNQCKSATTDPVRDREGLNFCEEFEFKEDVGSQDKTRGSGREKWNRLFGGP